MIDPLQPGDTDSPSVQSEIPLFASKIATVTTDTLDTDPVASEN